MWRHLFPPNCPPSQAAYEDIDPVYRLVASYHITVDDFKPNLVKFPNKNYQNNCLAAGISVFEDYNAITAIQQRIPAFKNKLISKGNITRKDGEIKRGNNHHITWWLNLNNPQNKFKVIP